MSNLPSSSSRLENPTGPLSLLSAPRLLQLLSTLTIMPAMEPSLKPIKNLPFTSETLWSIKEYLPNEYKEQYQK